MLAIVWSMGAKSSLPLSRDLYVRDSESSSSLGDPWNLDVFSICGKPRLLDVIVHDSTFIHKIRSTYGLIRVTHPPMPLRHTNSRPTLKDTRLTAACQNCSVACATNFLRQHQHHLYYSNTVLSTNQSLYLTKDNTRRGSFFLRNLLMAGFSPASLPDARYCQLADISQPPFIRTETINPPKERG